MKRPWSKTMVETSGQAQTQQRSPSRSKSDIRSIKGRISGPIQIATPIEAGIPMAKDTNSAEDDEASLAADMDPKPATPARDTPEDQRDTGARWTPETSQQHVRIEHQHGDDEGAAQNGAAATGSSRNITPSSGPHTRQPSKNARMSYFSAGSTNNGKEGAIKKKQGLRGALGRLFGRRKKIVSQASTWDTSSTRPTPDLSQHRAELAQRDGSQAIGADKPEHKRSVSMPLSEKDRALRSHSIGLRDRIAIESARDSLRVDSNFSRRRPGTQSLRRSRTSNELHGLTPRPASASERTIKTVHVEDPSMIGRAISGDQVDHRTLKRRSRSLTALALAENEHRIDRRRSGEIRYWRASYGPDGPEYKSPSSSAHPEQDEQRSETDGARAPLQEHSRPTLEPFPFSDEALAGVKITAAASLEARISRLEDRYQLLWGHFDEMQRLFQDVRAEQMSLKSLQPMDKFLDGNSPQPRRMGHEGEVNADERSFSTGFDSMGVGDSTRIYNRAESMPLFAAAPATKKVLRPESTATIRGVASLPLLTRGTSEALTTEQYTTLIALLETERSARQALETKVKTLDYQISIMRKQSLQTNGLGHSKLSFGGSAFDDDSDDGETKYYGPAGSATYVDEDESYATPHEPDSTDDEVVGTRKSDRTLSLSKMTMQGFRGRHISHEPLPGH